MAADRRCVVDWLCCRLVARMNVIFSVSVLCKDERLAVRPVSVEVLSHCFQDMTTLVNVNETYSLSAYFSLHCFIGYLQHLSHVRCCDRLCHVNYVAILYF
jgi:hypothetical protein